MTTKSIRKLVDSYADLALQRQAIDRQLAELRPAVVALGEGPHKGRDHIVTVDHTTRASISVAVAKSFLTPAEILQATVVSDITTVRVEV